MRSIVSVTNNISSLLRAIEALQHRGMRQEGMGLYYGEPGTGKTTALAYVQQRTDAAAVRACSTWSTNSMLGQLLLELNLDPTGSSHNRLMRVAEHLSLYPRPLMVDEADYLLRSPSQFDVLRDIYDIARIPVVLVGMEDAAQKINSHPRMTRHRRRITQWIKTQPLARSEMDGVVNDICEVGVDAPLIDRIHAETHGNMGRVITALATVEHTGQSNDLAIVQLNHMAGVSLLEAA